MAIITWYATTVFSPRWLNSLWPRLGQGLQFDFRFRQYLKFQSSTPGEPPPPSPRACFGRDDLTEKIVGLAESLTPVALIGPGGIGKTSVALSVLHHDRIKHRFGDNRRFIRCDQFPPSRAHFLARLSKVIGAGVENPEDLIPLRTSLSSEEMMIIIDNAEVVLDPQGTDGQSIYRVVEELSQFSNICVIVTSRITAVPPTCETIDVPTLSTGAARDTFYNIYKCGNRSDAVNDILRRLDFHPLSVTLLATAAHQNRWDNNRLVKEWEKRQTGVLQTAHHTSLASTIELSIASPMFKDLGPGVRELLGVVAFYPQGVNENNFEWLFPTISDATHLLDAFCILSLTYRTNGFITMLAPLRDYLRPKDPTSSALFCATTACYFTRMSVELGPDKPGFKDSEWIVSEDVNVEHLLDVLTTIDPDSDDIWNALFNFLDHMRMHKPRRTTLRARVEALPDSHPHKPRCLDFLGMLSGAVGTPVDNLRLLNRALELWRERRNDYRVAYTLRELSGSNWMLRRYEEGISQAKEALVIYQRLGEPVGCAWCLSYLSGLLRDDGQLDASEEATIRGILLLPEKGQEHLFYSLNRTLGDLYATKREREKAIHYLETAFRIASSFNWHPQLFSVHRSMAYLFFVEGEFDDAHAHAQRAKSHASNNPYHLGLAALLLAKSRYRQHGLEDATSEALYALEIFEEVGAPEHEQEECRTLLRDIKKALNGGLPETPIRPASTDASLARGISPAGTPADPHHDSNQTFG